MSWPILQLRVSKSSQSDSGPHRRPSLCRLLFFSAKPTDPALFESLRKEASAKGDLVVLPFVWESYHNISHQTLEVLRFAAADRDATHILKVGSAVCPGPCGEWRWAGRRGLGGGGHH